MRKLSIVLPLVMAGSCLAQQTGLVKTADVDLAFEVYGEGPPVIVANGGPGLSHVYMIQNDVWTARLAKGHRIVFYDQRGTGKSVRMKEEAPQTMDAQVADLEAVRAHFEFAKFALVGDSYGGLLAMAYAAAHPERVERLVLSDSAAPALKDTVHVLQQVFPDLAQQHFDDPREQLVNHFRMLFYSEKKRDEYLAGVKDLGSSPKAGAAVSAAIRNLDLTAALPKFNFPTLVITGRYDMNVAPVTAWKIYKAIPGAKLEIFARSGHLPYYEEPDKYVEVLSDFLRDRLGL
jgi:proline iminopeptidase